jgi:hypothetical protein
MFITKVADINEVCIYVVFQFLYDDLLLGKLIKFGLELQVRLE